MSAHDPRQISSPAPNSSAHLHNSATSCILFCRERIGFVRRPPSGGSLEREIEARLMAKQRTLLASQRALFFFAPLQESPPSWFSRRQRASTKHDVQKRNKKCAPKLNSRTQKTFVKIRAIRGSKPWPLTEATILLNSPPPSLRYDPFCRCTRLG
jgi:hypothetical protein